MFVINNFAWKDKNDKVYNQMTVNDNDDNFELKYSPLFGLITNKKTKIFFK